MTFHPGIKSEPFPDVVVNEAVRWKAKELAGKLETGYMELAKLLFEVCEAKDSKPPLYIQWGFKTFENYAREELGIHERKAKYLRRIWFRLEVELVGLDASIKNEVIKLGWTKTRELIKVLTLQNAAGWVEIAKNNNFATLCVFIQRYQNDLEEAQKEKTKPQEVPLPEQEKFTYKHLAFGESQTPIIEAALEKAAIIAESDSDNNLFTMICTDFLATTIVGDGPLSKLKYLAKLEDQMGLRLVAVNPKTNEVIYGIETLENLAGNTEGEK